MHLKRPLMGLLIAILLIVGIVTLSAQAAGVNPIRHLQQITQQVFLPLLIKNQVTETPAPTPTNTNTPTTAPSSTVSPFPTSSVTLVPPSGSIVINRHSVDLYDRIPSQYMQAAENIRFVFMDRSVGVNINDGLTCLASSTWASSAANCRRSYIDESLTNWKTFTTNDNQIPESILFPGGSSRSNIEFITGMGTWEEDLNAFINLYPTYANRDIFTFQHNYLHVAAGSTIDNVYFDPNYNGTNIYDLMALETRYPNKTFVYWTTSLALSVGTADAQSFNDQMRNWTATNRKVLLDVADIESHSPDGSACRNAQGYEVICEHYTTETDGGHLGSVSDGKIRIAKAIWVMLAQIAGWQP
ncbi:MAG: hypothetical protein CVU39_11720 [Chloroflexi bacterium HGW-Chloroflexi-10]|nr:MAG: hypothetical protein CVU39_11720 [Chloroflexi bacterium HGW-Chloroflexi-10]